MAHQNPRQQLLAARQMKRLRELRERTALSALRKAERAAQEAAQAVCEREAVIRQLQQQRQQLSHRIVGDCAARMGLLAAYASATQEVLDDQLERAEYGLIDDEEALLTARRKAHEAHQIWLYSVGQSQSAENLVADAGKAVRRDQEVRQEREDPPPHRPML